MHASAAGRARRRPRRRSVAAQQRAARRGRRAAGPPRARGAATSASRSAGGQAAQVDAAAAANGAGRDDLDRARRPRAAKRGAQRLVAARRSPPGSARGPRRPSAPAQARGRVACCSAGSGLELVEEPEPLLGEGQRAAAPRPPARDRVAGRASMPRCAAAARAARASARSAGRRDLAPRSSASPPRAPRPAAARSTSSSERPLDAPHEPGDLQRPGRAGARPPRSGGEPGDGGRVEQRLQLQRHAGRSRAGG